MDDPRNPTQVPLEFDFTGVPAGAPKGQDSFQKFAPWVALFVVAGLTMIAVVLTFRLLQSRPYDLQPLTQAAEGELVAVLRKRRVPLDAVTQTSNDILRNAQGVWRTAQYEVAAPDHIDTAGLRNDLVSVFQHEGYFVGEDRPGSDAMVVYAGRFPLLYLAIASRTPDRSAHATDRETTAIVRDEPGPRREIVLEPYLEVESPADWRNAKAIPRLALILDDGGYGGEWTERILSLDIPLTIAILPYTPDGTELARRAARLGFEVMLHMPMENHDANRYHRGQLSVEMDAATIRTLTLAALNQVPFAAGINNHTGSRFTADRPAMNRFFAAIVDRPVYFIDSRTTAETQAHAAAIAHGVPAASRTFFLDHDDNVAAIRAQFLEAVEMTKLSGATIAIAHFRPNTAQVLEEMVPYARDRGIYFVYASELVR